MIIQPDNNGWSNSTHGPYQLIFNDKYIIKLIELINSNSGTSTQEKLFVGTREECEEKIKELNLPLVSKHSLGEIEEEPIQEIPIPLEY